MKMDQIKTTFQLVMEKLQDERPSTLRQMLEGAKESLQQMGAREEEHQAGIRNNDSYYLFRRTSVAQEALASYHYQSLEELNNERDELRMKLLLIPLILEEANEEYDFLNN